jgi:hypothetical protein
MRSLKLVRVNILNMNKTGHEPQIGLYVRPSKFGLHGGSCPNGAKACSLQAPSLYADAPESWTCMLLRLTSVTY